MNMSRTKQDMPSVHFWKGTSITCRLCEQMLACCALLRYNMLLRFQVAFEQLRLGLELAQNTSTTVFDHDSESELFVPSILVSSLFANHAPVHAMCCWPKETLLENLDVAAPCIMLSTTRHVIPKSDSCSPLVITQYHAQQCDSG